MPQLRSPAVARTNNPAGAQTAGKSGARVFTTTPTRHSHPEKLQRQTQTPHTDTPSAGLSTVADTLRQGGRPLDPATRAFFEPRFGVDFSAVRIHTDIHAAESARAVNALAYTVGRDVVFNSGQYAPHRDSGRRLLAHELTHVVQQQGGADGTNVVQRSPLNVTEISDDITTGASTHPDLFSWLHVMGARSGEIAHAAAATGAGPDPAPVPTDSSLPINAHFFPSYQRHTDRRALIIGGFHGDERPGYEVADALVSELQQSSGPGYVLAFHTLIIPRLNLGAITDELAGAPGYDTRCNRQLVDLNRNFPSAGATHSSPRCRNTATAPVQPETQGVIDVIASFRPHRIISTHAISELSSAGVFADPNTHPSATALACSLAGRIVDPSDRPANRLTSTSCNPVYPGDRSGALPSGGTLGRYGVRIDPHSQEVTPVITLEAPEYGSLGTGTGARTVEAFLRPLRAFISDIGGSLGSEDAAILNDIRAFSLASRRLFLSGRLPTGESIYARIKARIDARVAALNALVPRAPVSARVVSQQRAFADPIGRATPQSQLVFEKFTLTGSKAGGWDSLPDRYFTGGRRRSQCLAVRIFCYATRHHPALLRGSRCVAPPLGDRGRPQLDHIERLGRDDRSRGQTRIAVRAWTVAAGQRQSRRVYPDLHGRSIRRS
jgi:hypothetical protein